MRVDFHLHTNWSDGTLPTGELTERLKQSGISCFAVADHDTMKAHEELALEDEGSPPMESGGILKGFVGVEINTNERKETLHILGYGKCLLRNPVFQEKLAVLRGLRRKRIENVVVKLQALGFEITLSEVEAKSKDSLGRPHVAEVLRAKGIVSSWEEAFRRFLLKGRPAYAPPLCPDAKEAIGYIVEAGGLAVLAHPGVAGIDDEQLACFVDAGLKGLEVFYPGHSESQLRRYLSAAKKYGLYVTCGSDYHGPGSGREEVSSFEFEPEEFRDFTQAISY